MPERSEEERLRVGDEDVDEAQGGQDQPEGGHGEDGAVHAGGDPGDWSHLLSFSRSVGSAWVQWGSAGNTGSRLSVGPMFSTWIRNKIFHLFKMMETKV